ncbi:hypothetical protein NKH23_13700 [Mesorhizobium sp. M1328]|uniref:hypothetical protein n=1 Tax=Mesorhizobium sp. M1328 TaxID=2957082 RepID=UPI00333C7C0A
MSFAVRRASSADIIGNGPAALVAAIALARREWKIKLITPPRRRPYQPRIDVLGASALPVLLRLGLSIDEIHAVARPCPGSCSRWDTCDAHCHDYLTGPYGSAWAVDRPGLETLLQYHVAKAGIALASDKDPTVSSDNDAALTPEQHDGKWRILATGAVNSRSGLKSESEYDDRLIALVMYGRVDAGGEPLDARLLIEAAADGWAYGIVGPGNRACLGVITDAEALIGSTPHSLASRVLDATTGIARLASKLNEPVSFHTFPVRCRWLPLNVAHNTLRLGDAQASFDPLAGRGLWSAIRMAEEMAMMLDARPNRLALLEHRARVSYQHYLTERVSLYRAGRQRFGTGFWARRYGLDTKHDSAHTNEARSKANGALFQSV